MTVEDADQLAAPNETLYEFITRHATGASNRALFVMLVTALVVGTTLAAFSLRFIPVAAACGSLSSIALWGILEHQRIHHPSRLIGVVESVLVITGCLFAAVAMMSALYAVLGSGWIH